jgi:hypothetical protein
MSDEKPGRPLAVSVVAAIATVLVGTVLVDVWLDVDYRVAANCSLVAAAVFVNVFTVLYGIRSRWRSNRIGAIYLIKCVGLSVFLTQAALATWWDTDYPFRQQIRFGIYTTMAMVYLPMLVTLWREQQRDRDGQYDDLELPPGVPPL